MVTLRSSIPKVEPIKVRNLCAKVKKESLIVHKTVPEAKEEPIKVQKFFDVGWFEGTVTGTRVDEDGQTLFLVVYEDDDQEEVYDYELEILVSNYKLDKKAQSGDGLADYIDAMEAEIVEPLAKRGNGKQGPAKKKNGFIAHTSHESSLWQTLPPIDGEPVTRDLIASFAAQNPPENLPQGLHSRIPEMVEFYVFMLERQRIQQGKKTDLRVLRDFHWCNNYRELDRGTAYFRSQVLKLVNENPQMSRLQYVEQVLAMSYYYRQCNLIESFTHPTNPAGGIPRLGSFDAAFIDYVRSHVREGKTFFTRAHLNQGIDRYINYSQTSTVLLQNIARAITKSRRQGLEEVCKCLRSLPGVGDFTCWQIACDLEESCCFGPKFRIDQDGVEELMEVEDDHCELGPGAVLGVRKIFGEKIYSKLSKKDLLGLAAYLLEHMGYCLGLVRQEFPLWKNRKVNMKVIEHVLCEYQKFTEIEAGYEKGQRPWRSRAMMDKREACCGQRMIRCDTCHYIGCEGCQQDKFQNIKPSAGLGWNCCKRCYALEQRVFAD